MRRMIPRFLIAALCGSVALLGACTSAPPQGASSGSPAQTSSVGTVFSWGDDLSQWVSEDEMTALLVELLGWEGTAVLSTTSGGGLGVVVRGLPRRR